MRLPLVTERLAVSVTTADYRLGPMPLRLSGMASRSVELKEVQARSQRGQRIERRLEAVDCMPPLRVEMLPTSLCRKARWRMLFLAAGAAEVVVATEEAGLAVVPGVTAEEAALLAAEGSPGERNPRFPVLRRVRIAA